MTRARIAIVTAAVLLAACTIFTNHGAPVYTYGPEPTENQRNMLGVQAPHDAGRE